MLKELLNPYDGGDIFAVLFVISLYFSLLIYNSFLAMVVLIVAFVAILVMTTLEVLIKYHLKKKKDKDRHYFVKDDHFKGYKDEED